MKLDTFTDAELDALEAAQHGAYSDHVDALKHNLNLVTSRVEQLERAFTHVHKANPEAGDSCIQCGFDLRDPIHQRLTPLRERSKRTESAGGNDSE